MAYENIGERGGYMSGGDRGPRFKPVNVGDELDVRIEAVGEKGDGIAKKDGFVLFVPGVNEGDNVRIRVTKVLRKVGFAEVVGAGSAPEASQEEAPAEEEAPSEPEETQDTEDFGEESGSDEESASNVEEPEKPEEEKKE